VVYGVKKTIIT